MISILILSVFTAALAGTVHQSGTFVPIAIRATNGAWIGVRNKSNDSVEMCDLRVSVQANRARGTVGRVSGGTIGECDALSAHFILAPSESHFVWIDVPFRSTSQVTFSLRAEVFDAAGNPSAPISLLWHNWTEASVASPGSGMARWEGTTVTYRNLRWIRATNSSTSARAISIDEDAADVECSSARRFHLVLPGQSLVQGEVGNRTPERALNVFEADPETGRCLRVEQMVLRAR